MNTSTGNRDSAAGYDECVTRFYAAAVGNCSWSEACTALAHLTNVWCIQITGLDRRTGATRFSWDGGDVPAQAWLDYFTRYHKLNPRVPVGLKLEVGAWQHDHEVLPRDVLQNSPFFRDFLIPYGSRYCSATKLLEDDEMMVIAAALLPRDREPLTESEIALLERFRTHLIQAIEVYRTFQRGRTESLVARTMLDSLSQPVLLIDDTHYIHHANLPARSLLGDGRVLTDAGGSLRCRRPRDAGRLAAAMRQLGLTGSIRPEDVSSHVVFRVSDPAGRQDHLVIGIGVRPDESMGVFGEAPRAILLLHALHGQTDIDPLIVSHAFGLTPAEAEVASAIARGEPTTSVAESRGVTIETVRTQLRSVYAKVGVSRQAELARVLAMFPQTNLKLAHPHLIP